MAAVHGRGLIEAGAGAWPGVGVARAWPGAGAWPGPGRSGPLSSGSSSLRSPVNSRQSRGRGSPVEAGEGPGNRRSPEWAALVRKSAGGRGGWVVVSQFH